LFEAKSWGQILGQDSPNKFLERFATLAEEKQTVPSNPFTIHEK